MQTNHNSVVYDVAPVRNTFKYYLASAFLGLLIHLLAAATLPLNAPLTFSTAFVLAPAFVLSLALFAAVYMDMQPLWWTIALIISLASMVVLSGVAS